MAESDWAEKKRKVLLLVDDDKDVSLLSVWIAVVRAIMERRGIRCMRYMVVLMLFVCCIDK